MINSEELICHRAISLLVSVVWEITIYCDWTGKLVMGHLLAQWSLFYQPIWHASDDILSYLTMEQNVGKSGIMFFWKALV